MHREGGHVNAASGPSEALLRSLPVDLGFRAAGSLTVGLPDGTSFLSRFSCSLMSSTGLIATCSPGSIPCLTSTSEPSKLQCHLAPIETAVGPFHRHVVLTLVGEYGVHGTVRMFSRSESTIRSRRSCPAGDIQTLVQLDLRRVHLLDLVWTSCGSGRGPTLVTMPEKTRPGKASIFTSALCPGWTWSTIASATSALTSSAIRGRRCER